jgi:nitronate monooxygenase
VRGALGPEYPVLSAGGITSRDDASERFDAGAEAAVSGTRFLMSEESGAHPIYKQRLLDADETQLTELFGLGPAPHRVVPNAATRRWLRGDPRGPGWLRLFQLISAPAFSRMPVSMQLRAAATQSPSRPMFGPAAATADGPESLVDAGPLYAWECIERIGDIRSARELARELTP